MGESNNLHEYCLNVARRAKQAAEELVTRYRVQKREWLYRCARLLAERSVALAEANRLDIGKAPEFGLTEAAIDRLRLTPERIAEMAKALGGSGRDCRSRSARSSRRRSGPTAWKCRRSACRWA